MFLHFRICLFCVVEDSSVIGGVFLQRMGKNETIPHAQARRGFSHVDEDVFKDYIESEGVEVPSIYDCAGDTKLEYVMAATKHIQPKWTTTDAIRAVHEGYQSAPLFH